MTPVFTTKGSRQHRYYVTRLKPGEGNQEAWRVPAGDIENVVLDFVSRSATHSGSGGDTEFAYIHELPVSQQRSILLAQKTEVRLGSDALEITFGSEAAESVRLSAKLRKGKELRLVVGDDSAQSRPPDTSLFRLATHAWAAQQALLTG